VVANDPDADRLAACVPTASGRWLTLTGNQIGLLLADFLLEHAPRTPRPLVVSSIVSSPMLADIARAHGARFERTLTGFKWIWGCALELEREAGVRFAFGYEEALGYSIGRVVRDKDGISAAVQLTDLVAHCRARGESLLERFERLARAHGLWVSVQKSLVLPGLDGRRAIAGGMERLRACPPTAIGGREVAGRTDYLQGAADRPRWLGVADLVELALSGGGRVLVRPSGTEPKLKLYVDLGSPVQAEVSFSDQDQAARSAAAAVADELAALLGFGPVAPAGA
jgi:phosphomannomutase